jgi:hypothetical protein
MSYPIYWDQSRVQAVFTTESRQKDQELFLQTHQPFRKIRVDFCKEDGGADTFIDEERVRTIVQAGSVDAHNRLFFIVGEAGCGKSELCQWLEYTVDPALRLPIHVPRSMTDALSVISLLREKLGESGSISPLQRTPFAVQAEYILHAAIVLLYEHGSTVLSPVNHWAKVLKDQALCQELTSQLEIGRAEILLSPERLRWLCAEHGLVLDAQQIDHMLGALDRLLTQAIDQTLWLSDLRTLLAQLSIQTVAQGRRPLLLIEDITAFQALGDLLLDYLLDLTSGHFDAVIGVTTGFERTQLTRATLAEDLTHVHHRLRARFVLTDDQGRTYGLEDELIDLTRAYLGAARSSDAPNLDHIFGTDLYPFTETALRRTFDSLEEEGNLRQTPRLLIEHVLGAALLAESPPPSTFARSLYLRQPPTLFRTDTVSDECLRDLLRWYGNIQEDVVTLDARIPAHWGIVVPEQLLHGALVAVPRAYIGATPSRVDIPTDWQSELRELQSWLSDGGYYPSRETLKRGIERVLLNLGDPRMLGSHRCLSMSRADICYARGDERLPIVLARSGDQPSASTSVVIHINGQSEDRAILEELAYASLSGDNLAQVCHNPVLTLEWAQGIWDGYHAQVRAVLCERLGGINAEQLIFVAWRLLCFLIASPWSTRPHVRSVGAIKQSYDHISPWTLAQHAACYSTGEALLPWYETIRRLFIGSFMLRDTLLDIGRFEPAITQIDPDAVILQMARLPLRDLRALPYKIRPGGQRLYDMLVPLQRYAKSLINLDIGAALRSDLDDLEWRDAHLTAQQTLDCMVLRQQISTLRWRCGEVGTRWRDTWDNTIEPLEHLSLDSLHDLHKDVIELRKMYKDASDAGSYTIWLYQELRLALRPVIEHPYWLAITTLREIQSELIRVARARYRQDRLDIMSTLAYRKLLQAAHAVQEEITNG